MFNANYSINQFHLEYKAKNWETIRGWNISNISNILNIGCVMWVCIGQAYSTFKAQVQKCYECDCLRKLDMIVGKLHKFMQRYD